MNNKKILILLLSVHHSIFSMSFLKKTEQNSNIAFVIQEENPKDTLFAIQEKNSKDVIFGFPQENLGSVIVKIEGNTTIFITEKMTYIVEKNLRKNDLGNDFLIIKNLCSKRKTTSKNPFSNKNDKNKIFQTSKF